MPFRTIDGVKQRYALISFDDKGAERQDDPAGGVFSREIVKAVQAEQPTHIFLYSHGWKGDIASAIDQYDRWIGAFCRLDADRQALGGAFKPFFIGLHWPSQPWGEEDIPASFAATVDPVLEAAVAHFGGSSAVREPLEVIVNAFNDDPTARELSPEVVAAYQSLGEAIGFSGGAEADAAPDREGVPLDPQAAVAVEDAVGAGESFGLFGSLKKGVLAGLRQASFWLMKHRARTVGEQGMHTLVADLQRVSPARIHLMGHSFGCIVVSSILGGPNGDSPLDRPVQSAVLVQGALSLWSYADTIPDSSKPGYFRRLLKGTVTGPVVTTQSSNDSAVGIAFPAAVGLVGEVDFDAAAVVKLPKFGGVGTWGVQGTALAEARPMLDVGGDYGFKPGRVYNVDGSKFIAGHSAIDGPEVAHLQWQAVLHSQEQP
jgi:hypothetical protein